MLYLIQDRVKRYKERVEELEEALKQSVKITAKCEMVVATQKEEIDKQTRLIEQVSLCFVILRKCTYMLYFCVGVCLCRCVICPCRCNVRDLF